jgi:biotin operon repressor
MRSKVMDTLDALVTRGQTVEEVAEAQGVSKQAIWQRIWRARKSGMPIPNLRWHLHSPKTFALQNYD